MAEYRKVKIDGAADAFYALQPAGSYTDLHTDPEHSLAYHLKGGKAWVAYPPTQHNKEIYLKMHEKSHHYDFLAGGALREMQGGRICLSGEGDLVFIPVGWFHFVFTLQPSILLGSWLVRNGFAMLLALHLSMVSIRKRFKGSNADGLLGWTESERIQFETGMKCMIEDIRHLLR